MGIVGHQPGVVTLRQRREGVQGRDIAIHGKDPVRRDQHVRVMLPQLGQQRLRVANVGVAKGHDCRAREACAGPQASVCEIVD